MKEEEAIKQRYELVAGELNERTRRLFAASEAMAIGLGRDLRRLTSDGTLRQGYQSRDPGTAGGGEPGEGRIRRKGGGRKSTVSKDPSLREDLERLVEPVTRGDPESPLRWTCKSVRKLAKELQAQGHQVSHRVGERVAARAGLQLASQPQDA